MSLCEQILALKQTTNAVTSNPLLNSFDDQLLAYIEAAATTDAFVLEKQRKMINLTRNLPIDFQEQLKTAFDEYSEALAYLFLKGKFPRTERIPECNTPTPDFTIEFAPSPYSGINELQRIYAELKTMSFADGRLNYKNAMNDAVESYIDIDKQIASGKRVAMGTHVIQPWLKSGRADYDPFSFKYVIEVFNEKIDQNIKPLQYAGGDTILLIDQQQLVVPNSCIEGGVPINISGQIKAPVSGIQWNVALGRPGQPIYRPLEFEGRENIEGELNTEGLLWKYDFIKAICFLHTPHETPTKREVLGLYRRDTVTEAVQSFLHRCCDFVNDDANTYGYKFFRQ
jgi:hypothetical protein